MSIARWFVLVLLGCIVSVWPAAAQPNFVLENFATADDDGDGFIQAGERLHFRVRVRNIGDQAGQIQFTGPYPEGFSDFQLPLLSGLEVVSFDPGGSQWSITYIVPADYPPPDQPQIVGGFSLLAPSCWKHFQHEVEPTIQARVDGVLLGSLTATERPILGADNFSFAFEKVPLDGDVTPGGVVDWQITATNLIPSREQRVVIRDFASEGLEFESADSEFGSCGAFPCTTVPIVLGCANQENNSVGVTISGRLPSVVQNGITTYCNTAELVFQGFVRNSSESCVELDPGSLTWDLVAGLSSPSGPVGPTDQVIFNLSGRNIGNSESPPSSLRMAIPPGTQYVSAGSSAWSCPSTVAGSICTLDLGGGVAGGGGERTATMVVQLLDPLPAVLSITGEMTVLPGTGDPTPGNNSATFSVPIDPNALSWDLVAGLSSPSGPVGPSDQVTFNLLGRNIGNSESPPSSLRMAIPLGTEYVSTGSSAWSCPSIVAGSVCTLDLGGGVAGGGEERTATMVVQVLDPLPAVLAITGEMTVLPDSGDPTPGNNSATFSVPIDPNALSWDLLAGLSSPSGPVGPSDQVTFNLLGRNIGNSESPPSSLRMAIPLGTEYVSTGSSAWSCPSTVAGSVCTLDLGGGVAGGGEERTATMVVQLLDPLPAVLSITGEMTVLPDTGDPTPGNNSATFSVPIDPNALSWDLLAGLSSPSGPVGPSDQVTFNLLGRNIGNSESPPSSLRMAIPPGTQYVSSGSSAWTCPSTVAGSVCTLDLGGGVAGGGEERTATMVVQLLDPLPAVLAITGEMTVLPESGDPTPGNNSATFSVPIDPNALSWDLLAGLSSPSGPVGPSDQVTFNLSGRNIGNSDSPPSSLRMAIPLGTQYLSTGSSAWSCPSTVAGSVCTLDLGGGVAGGGEERTATMVVQVLDPLPAVLAITGEMTVLPESGDPTPGNNSATFSVPIDESGLSRNLSAFKELQEGEPRPGGRLTFAVGALYEGNATATGVVIQETVPRGTTFSGTGSSAGWQCEGTTYPSTCSLSELGPVFPGEIRHNFAVDIVSPLPSGMMSIDNTVSIRMNEPETSLADNDADLSVPIELGPGDGPDWVISKTANRLEVGAGEEIEWTLTVSNAGNVGAVGGVLVDRIPEFTYVVEQGTDPEFLCSIDDCTLDLPPIENGEALTYKLVTMLGSALPADAERILNEATVTGPGDVDSRNNRAVATVDLQVGGGHGPDMRLIKTADREETMEGEYVTYSLDVFAQGDQGSTGVMVLETVPEWTTAPTPGEGWACNGSGPGSTCSYELGTLESQEARLLNFTVVVDSELGPDAVQIVNTGQVVSDVDADVANDISIVRTPLVGAPPPELPDLVVSLNDGDVVIRPGLEGQDQATLHLRVGNQGTSAAESMEVELVIGAPVEAVSDFRLESDVGTCFQEEELLRCVLQAAQPLEVGDFIEGSLVVKFGVEITGPVVQSIFTAFATEELNPEDNRAVADTEVVPLIGNADLHFTLRDRPLPLDNEVYLHAIESLVAQWNQDQGFPPEDYLEWTHPIFRWIEYEAVLTVEAGAFIGGLVEPRPIAGSFYLQPVVGSVTPSAGTVVVGEGRWGVDLEPMVSDDSVTIQWVELVSTDAPSELGFVERQLRATSIGNEPAVSDDPDTFTEVGDPTETRLGGWGSPINVPTASVVGLCLLALALALAAIRLMRPAEARTEVE